VHGQGWQFGARDLGKTMGRHHEMQMAPRLSSGSQGSVMELSPFSHFYDLQNNHNRKHRAIFTAAA
jgi:hypothetical protein